jgi:putative hemolysin
MNVNVNVNVTYKSLVLVSCITAALASAAVACTDDSSEGGNPVIEPKPLTEDERGSVGPANPASVYCAKLGYKAEGEQCIFPDGTSCEQWAFWRAQCGQSFSYCNRQGGQVKNEEADAGGFTTNSAVCTLKDGKRCDEHRFHESGKCE